MATILTKKKDTSGAPSAGDLTNSSGGAELAVNTADKRLYTKDSGGNVVEVGINPTSITTGTLNTSGTVVFNDAGADVDFRVESDTDANALFVEGSSGNVGIGTSSPSEKLHVVDNTDKTMDSAGSGQLRIVGGVSGYSFAIALDATASYIYNNAASRAMVFGTNETERMRIDSSGNVLVGTTSSIVSDGSGIALQAGGRFVSRYAGSSTFDRRSTDGDILAFAKDGTTVGSIEIQSHGFEINGESSHAGISFATAAWIPKQNGSRIDNVIDLGSSTYKFDDIYATNDVIQTSDANEKQDIEALSEAETRVAVAAKGLLKKYRWKSAVAEKGDDARIHFGIIAQDLKAAFEAEGLDAGRYAMFIHSEWWETQTEVPAVEAQEAVLDDEGNVVQEAVESKEAHTRTDTYETEEEAPEGAVRKERMGIRYNELLAFIIAAL